ncbi:MAG: hypothetical protein ACK5Y6_00025 [Pseudomonadota bacterium]
MSFRRLSIQQWRIVIALAMVVLFVIGLVGKIHFSSIGMWNEYLDKRERPAGLLAGNPQPIRSDEWFLGVPWLLSQVNSNPSLPTNNPAVGPDTAALAVGLPTRHWTGLFRPAHWGFYLLDAEHGFSWYWLTRTVVCFAFLALLFLELAGGSIILALVGASWVFFSAFTQWWLASIAEMLLYFASACVALRWLAIAGDSLRAVAASVLLLVSAVAFAITLYPPFQIPLVYLGLLITPLLLRGAVSARGPSKPLRLALFGGAVMFGLGCVALFLIANSEVFKVMEQTVYPGKRVSLGGGMNSVRFFSGFFDQLNSFQRFPAPLGNVCEASAMIMLWPVSALLWLLGGSARRSLALLPLLFYLVLVTAWSWFGVSEGVASATLWSYVPLTRAFIGVGLGGAIFSIVVLAEERRVNKAMGVALSLVACAWLWWIANQYAATLGDGFTVGELQYAAAVIGVLALALVWRLRWVALVAVSLACIYPHGLVNPVMSGMEVLSSSKLVRAVSRFDPDKKGRWAVFGSMIHAQLIKTSGRRVINGSQYLPDLDLLAKLDPERRFDSVYNRYAHVVYDVAPEGATPTFTLIAPDVWQLTVDPCHESFRALGIDYIVLVPRPKRPSFECFERVFLESNFAVYKRR